MTFQAAASRRMGCGGDQCAEQEADNRAAVHSVFLGPEPFAVS
jgi:hypothetical protein